MCGHTSERSERHQRHGAAISGDGVGESCTVPPARPYAAVRVGGCGYAGPNSRGWKEGIGCSRRHDCRWRIILGGCLAWGPFDFLGCGLADWATPKQVDCLTPKQVDCLTPRQVERPNPRQVERPAPEQVDWPAPGQARAQVSWRFVWRGRSGGESCRPAWRFR